MSNLGDKHSHKNRRNCLVPLSIGGVVGFLLLFAAFVVIIRSPLGPKIARTAERVSLKLGGESLFPERVVIREELLEVPIDANAGDETGESSNDVRRLANGIHYEVDLLPQREGTAIVNREESEAYRIEMKVIVKRPDAPTMGSTLVPSGSTVLKALPGLAKALESAKVSPFYEQLYENKEGAIRRNLFDFHRILSRHTYFDCNAILELQDPESGQRALWVQADMDIVSDGSDGDRLQDIDNEVFSSANYQPTTSYGWAKKSKKRNPFLNRVEKRLKEAEDEFAKPGLSIEVNRKLRARIAADKPLVDDLKARSYLIARYDPFMVLPVFMVTAEKGDFTPRVGDYAVVFHDGKLYPSIVGDAGPNYKIGESSLRMGMEIDPKTNPYRRPVSDLTVSYIVFPGSADRPFSPPDYAVWRDKVNELLKGFGGVGEGFSLHEWEDQIPKPIVKEPVLPVVAPTESNSAGNDS